MRGTINQLFEGRCFGFLKGEDGREILFYMSDVEDIEFQFLAERKNVEFIVEKNPKGRRSRGRRATNVKVMD